MKYLILCVTACLLYFSPTSSLAQNDDRLIIDGPNDVSMHIDGVELRDEVGDFVPDARQGTFLILYFNIVNESSRQRCVFARDIRLVIDDEEYAPQAWLMDAVADTLEPAREFTGAVFGHCVEQNGEVESFAAFDLPEVSGDVEISFYDNVETLNLDDFLLEESSTEATNDDTEEADVTPALVTGTITSTQNVNARSCASTDCAVVVVLSPSTMVTVIGEDNGWYRIVTEDETEAYVFADLIEVTGEIVEVTEDEATTTTSDDDEDDNPLSFRDASDEEQASIIRSGISYVIVANDLDFTVETVEIADGRPNGGERALIIGYTSRVAGSEELVGELGYVFGGVGGAIREFDIDIDSVSVIIGDVLGNAVGIVGVSADDLLDFINGESTAAEFFGTWEVAAFGDE